MNEKPQNPNKENKNEESKKRGPYNKVKEKSFNDLIKEQYTPEEIQEAYDNNNGEIWVTTDSGKRVMVRLY